MATHSSTWAYLAIFIQATTKGYRDREGNIFFKYLVFFFFFALEVETFRLLWLRTNTSRNGNRELESVSFCSFGVGSFFCVICHTQALGYKEVWGIHRNLGNSITHSLCGHDTQQKGCWSKSLFPLLGVLSSALMWLV